MKNKLILIILVCISSSVFSQKPEPVNSFVREKHTNEWYETQQHLWKKEVEKNKQNADAWMNYYRATRALRLLCAENESDQKKAEENRAKYKKVCQEIADEIYALLPTSFEANFIKSSESDLPTNKQYLLKAHEINPNDVRTYTDLMVYYEFIQNREEFEKIRAKVFQANILPASLIAWAHNLLSELEPNAIIITGGDNDTFALWVAQHVGNFRPDVQVINTFMIKEDAFRNLLFEKMGLKKLALNCKTAKTEAEDEANSDAIFAHLKACHRPLYISSSVIHLFEKKWENELYITGLGYKYSKTSFDNLALIRRNVEKRYLLDHLTENFSFNPGDAIAIELNSTYLPAFLKLYIHYRKCEENEKLKTLEELILKIAEKSNQLEEVKAAMYVEK